MEKTPSRGAAAPHLQLIATMLLAVSQLSCAMGGLTPMKQSMPVARASLLPEYHLFYDTLVDYGQWVLIEPHGYVFRPSVSFDTWRPFGNGFWVPTDIYGWVWVSAEPFGWATYHYGQWLYDPYQRWVWIPGMEWAPARVAWEATDDYVGWAPLIPRGASYNDIPGGGFSFVKAGDLADTDLKNKVVTQQELGNRAAAAAPVDNPGEEDGVRFNRGPSLEWIERSSGRLRRARLDDVVVLPKATAAGGTTKTPASTPPPDVGSGAPSDTVIATQRAAEQVARQARAIVDRGGAAPARLQVVRPIGVPGAEPAAKAPASKAVPDKKAVAKPTTP
jgi:hypothetical protein